MGTVVSQAADGFGALLGNAFVAPFKAIFGGSCEGVCSGTWDLPCFIEHLCVSNLVKLLMVSGLCYITLLFLYLLFKVGICQCIGRSLCKMCWAACETYWFTLKDITCFLFHKLKNVKRVNRRRRRWQFQDAEAGYSSSGGETCKIAAIRKNKLNRKRRKGRVRSSLNRHPCHLRLNGREESFHLKERSRELKKLRHHQMRKASSLRREAALFERRLRTRAAAAMRGRGRGGRGGGQEATKPKRVGTTQVSRDGDTRIIFESHRTSAQGSVSIQARHFSSGANRKKNEINGYSGSIATW